MGKIHIMGILNVTPDSFSDGGIYYQNPDKAVAHALKMVDEGADILDIGGESTRPGSKSVTVDEEIDRVLPVIALLKERLGEKASISIDTNKSEVARTALANGAKIVNSLGGLTLDKHLADVVSQAHCTFIIYHIKGKPKTMQQGEIIYDDVIKNITKFFENQIAYGENHGINRNQFIIDPGVGFGKTVEQNVVIIKRLDEFRSLNLPILIGVSRKSHLGKILQSKLQLSHIPTPLERLEAALAETAIAVINGATIIRTHDVSQTKKFVTVLENFIK